MGKPNPISIIRPGGRINDLRGKRFGRLTVKHFAGIRWNHAHWCCLCDCLPTCRNCQGRGCTTNPQGTDLVKGRALSCGCSRTDSEVRRNAALRVPVGVRKARAQAAANKCRGVKPPPHFKLLLSRAADLLNATPEFVLELSRQGLIRTCIRNHQIKVSAVDVAEYIAIRAREPKSCPVSKGEPGGIANGR